jgi:hypothetical protein
MVPVVLLALQQQILIDNKGASKPMRCAKRSEAICKSVYSVGVLSPC